MRKPNLGILIKPASHDCNMACDYCYYRPVEHLYRDTARPRMEPAAFEAVCEQYRALGPSEIKVGWQGGEPTLMGLDFFRRAIEIETRCARAGDCWGNSLQTNGVVLDEQWCRFLAQNRFLVGVSVDGPGELNANRKFPNAKPAYQQTMRAIEMLREHGAEYNILVVISQANVDHPHEVFRFLLHNEFRFAQFIPCTEPPGEGAPGQRAGPAGRVSDHSVSAAEYADFMIALFDAWVENDDPSYYVRRIDNWLHLHFGLPPECCEYRADCSNLVTVEWNGDVYPCDFYVEEQYRLGNVRDKTIEQMLREPTFREFVRRAEHVPEACRGCRWLGICHGGCFRHREKLGIGEDAAPYLCEAKKRIFGHVFARLRRIQQERDPPRLHAFLKDVERRISDQQHSRPGPRRPSPAGRVRGGTGRNARCPCGSGRKFKHCCGAPSGARSTS